LARLTLADKHRLDLLLTVTITVNKLLSGLTLMILNDLKPPTIGGFSIFCYFPLQRTLKE